MMKKLLFLILSFFSFQNAWATESGKIPKISPEPLDNCLIEARFYDTYKGTSNTKFFNDLGQFRNQVSAHFTSHGYPIDLPEQSGNYKIPFIYNPKDLLDHLPSIKKCGDVWPYYHSVTIWGHVWNNPRMTFGHLGFDFKFIKKEDKEEPDEPDQPEQPKVPKNPPDPDDKMPKDPLDPDDKTPKDPLDPDDKMPKSEEPVLPKMEKNNRWKGDFFLKSSSSATCPADKSFTVFGKQISFSWQPFCDLMITLRPFVIALSMFLSGLMVFNSLRAK